MNSAMSVAERRERWSKVLQNERGGPWDWKPGIIAVASAQFEDLGRIVGPETAARLSLHLSDPPLAADASDLSCKARSWNAVERSSENWQVHEILRRLGPFGRHDVLDASIPAPSRQAHIEALLNEGDAVLWAWPIEHVAKKLNRPMFRHAIDRLVRMACYRCWALDDGTGSETDPVALAQFGGVSEGRLRNLTSEGRVLESCAAGMITSHSARQWLEGRPAFWPSIWREEE